MDVGPSDKQNKSQKQGKLFEIMLFCSEPNVSTGISAHIYVNIYL